MAPVPDMQYAEVRARCGACIHPARSAGQADLYELDWEGRPALLKDFSQRPRLVRWLFSRRIAAREVRMLRRLEGLEGTPRLLATAGPEAFVMERLPGERIPNRKRGGPPAIFWANARALLDQLHARGVAHGDLRRKNILAGPNGEAYLIDFATAIRRDTPGGGRGSWLGGYLFKRCRTIDRNSFARIKAQYAPEALDATERRWLEQMPLYLRVGRMLKKRVYRLRKRRYWRKRVKWVKWLRRKLRARKSQGRRRSRG
ncbi:MAG: serine/threonine protein kinase [candidate division BRC1 bacterium ADurb.BinA292]|nr:MAG: serine/threonine protein kinase [candidate division BRC1 bacterium ADurb.BinA292]